MDIDTWGPKERMIYLVTVLLNQTQVPEVEFY